MENFEDLESAAVDAVDPTDREATYEAPELVELGKATTLTRGNVYTKYYTDCGDYGTTDYRPSC